MKLPRRTIVKGLAAVVATGVAAPSILRAQDTNDELSNDVAEVLMLGFTGRTVRSDMARTLSDHIDKGRVRAAFFVLENVGTRAEFIDVVRALKPRDDTRALVAIDHEGGFVQRLTRAHGFTDLPAAKTVAHELSTDQARNLYGKAARELADTGININLGPVVDLHDTNNPSVGHFGRAYDADPIRVASYAEAFIDGFGTSNIACVVKHFPGHGRSRGDSHNELPDITRTWTEEEIEPYIRLIASGRARLIMGGHLQLAMTRGDTTPTTLSYKITTEMLRNRLGFKGVCMTDDLDMTAISKRMNRSEAFVRALVAGNDLLMIRNVINHDPELPQHAVGWVRDAIKNGVLARERLREAASRAAKLRAAVADGELGRMTASLRP